MESERAREGLRALREGILYEVIATVLIMVATVAFWLYTILPALVIFLAGLALGIVAIVKVYGGFSAIEDEVPNAALGKAGIIMTVLPVISFIGYIFVGVAIYSLGHMMNNGTVEAGGILTAIPFLNFVGLVVAYVGLA